MREFIAKFGIYVIATCLLIAGFIAFRSFSKPAPPHQSEDLSSAFYIDEETGEESIRPINLAPPLQGSAGKPTVVRVIKFSCDGGKTLENLYYFKYTEDIQAELEKLPPNDSDVQRSRLESKGNLVRSPGQEKSWVAADSKEGEALMTLPTCPNGKSATIINPPKR